jgi:MFS family permease
MTRIERKALFYTSVIALGGFLFGFDAAVISGVVGFVTPEFGLNEWWVGAVVSAQEATHNLLAKIKDMFRPELRMVLVVGLIAGIAQQSSGINVVYFYAPTIFEQSGVGRKPLMIAGLVGVAVSMLVSSHLSRFPAAP